MQKFSVFLVVGFLCLTGCHPSGDDARIFHPWGLENAKDARAYWGSYKNIFIVCISEDHWENRGPHRYSLHHCVGTVVTVYKGDWHVSEKIAFVQGLDYEAPAETNENAGLLGFVFTNQHTNVEFLLDTGEFSNYNAEYEPALNYVYSQSSCR